MPTDDGLLRLTLGDEAQNSSRKRKELVQGPNGKMLMIESVAVSNPVADLESANEPSQQALIKVDKGKGRAQEDADDEDQVMALVALDGEDANESGNANAVTMIRPAPSLNAPDISEQQLVIPNALPLAAAGPSLPSKDTLTELSLPADSHLARALNEAGLPETALMNEDGQLVPARDVASGSGDGMGRGELEKKRRELIEKAVMADEQDSRERVVPTWAYKVSRPCHRAVGLGSIQVESNWVSVDEKRIHVRSRCRCRPIETASYLCHGFRIASEPSRDLAWQYQNEGRG